MAKLPSRALAKHLGVKAEGDFARLQEYLREKIQ